MPVTTSKHVPNIIDWQKPDSWSVLIVDDEADNVDIVKLFLEFLGATVRTAEDGQSGLEALRSYQPTLILLDLSMPVMDGWEMLRRLRNDEAFSDVRDTWVIALTAHAMHGDRERVRAAGFDGYLTKPIDLPSLLIDLQRANFVTPPELTPAAPPAPSAQPAADATPAAPADAAPASLAEASRLSPAAADRIPDPMVVPAPEPKPMSTPYAVTQPSANGQDRYTP